MHAKQTFSKRTNRETGWLCERNIKRALKNAPSASLMSFTQPIRNTTAAVKPLLVGDFEINPSPDWAGAAPNRQDEQLHAERAVRWIESLYDCLARVNGPPDNTWKHREKRHLRLIELTKQISQ